MTVIAYRDGWLAADTQVDAGGLNYCHVKKIHKTRDGWLCAGAGDVANLPKLFDWADEDFDEELVPDFTDDLNAMVISPTGDVLLLDTHKHLIPATGKYFVAGAAGSIALGAMFMGANAVRAVEAAIEHCSLIGGEVEFVCLDTLPLL